MADRHCFALVTGASSGIGWHISKELAARGFSILAVSNQPEQLELLRIEIENQGVVLESLSCDLATVDAPQIMFHYCQDKGLDIEVLVNNAGILVYGEVIATDVKLAQTILQLHMNTPALLCRLIGEQMAKKGKGYIMNVSSISAVMPYPALPYHFALRPHQNFPTEILKSLQNRNARTWN